MTNFKFIFWIFVFICSSCCALLINKYVLWTLRFTFPTVFQSLQMSAVVFIMFSLYVLGVIRIQCLKMELLAWLPAIISFSVSIYFGSKALAILPVPIFTLIQQVLTHSALISMRWLNADKALSPWIILSVTASWCCVIILFVFHVSLHSCRWILIHCAANAVYSCYAQFVNKVEIAELDKMYMNALLSVIFLTIFGLETGETWRVFEFEHLTKLNFHLACVASGLLGAISILSYSELTSSYVSSEGARLYHTYSMILASLFSYLLYQQFSFSLYHVINLFGLFILGFHCTICYGKSSVTLKIVQENKVIKVAHI